MQYFLARGDAFIDVWCNFIGRNGNNTHEETKCENLKHGVLAQKKIEGMEGVRCRHRSMFEGPTVGVGLCEDLRLKYRICRSKMISAPKPL